MSIEEAAAEVPPTPRTRRELAVAQALDQARSRAENRVEQFLDAAREVMYSNDGEFTVQEVVERSGQSLRTFYHYFAGKHELLLALFEESIRSAVTHLQEVIAEAGEPLERLHRCVVEYYGMCRPAPKAQPPKGPTPAMVDFAQQLLTSHPKEASGAFVPLVALVEELLDHAEAAGDIRRDLDRRRIAGVMLQATMFNAFATTISGSPPLPDGRDAAEVHWGLLLRGIATDAVA
ncbi:MAG: TetR/AcrR family transcriptional regulator [Acidimicrobiia bacterium]